jgi:hypothetical protein
MDQWPGRLSPRRVLRLASADGLIAAGERGYGPHLPVRPAGRQLDELDGARLAGVWSEPGAQQVV